MFPPDNRHAKTSKSFCGGNDCITINLNGRQEKHILDAPAVRWSKALLHGVARLFESNGKWNLIAHRVHGFAHVQSIDNRSRASGLRWHEDCIVHESLQRDGRPSSHRVQEKLHDAMKQYLHLQDDTFNTRSSKLILPCICIQRGASTEWLEVNHTTMNYHGCIILQEPLASFHVWSPTNTSKSTVGKKKSRQAMRLCRVDVNGIGQLRLSRGSHVAQLPPSCSRLSDAMRCWHDLQALDARGGLAWKVEEGLRRLPPIEEGSNVVFCVGKNYLSHVDEVDSSNAMKSIAKGQAPEVPIIFSKPTRCLSGAEDPIPYPHGASQELDYEGELVVVIGKTGKNIEEDDAWDHVFGFTIANDVSARDAQRMHQQWHVGKSMDGFCPMGPTIVPKEEIVGSDGTLDLDITTMVNGKLRQHGNAKDMIFSVPEIIATVSKGFTLQPGDVILTGTPAGVGAGMKPPVFLKPGDEIEIAIQGIGAIKNRVE